MKDVYIALKAPGEAEFEEKKSRFIGCAAPIKSEEEALNFIKEVKAKYKKARHYVYAYNLCTEDGVLISRYSDDAEPQGTAGIPTLTSIQNMGIENAVVVVVRYFGGVLLGASGLTRAYRKAASLGLAACGVVKKILYDEVLVSIDYQVYNSVKYLLESGTNEIISKTNFRIIEETFGEDILIQMYIAVCDTKTICDSIFEITQGRASFIIEEKKGRYTE